MTMSTCLKTLSPAYRAKQLALALSDFDLKRSIATTWGAVRVDVAIIVGLTVLAAVPRLVLLTDIPPGLHGDEGWTGLDAHRILNEGWIGPYVGSALGQPAGPLYFAAPFIKVFGDTVFAVRLAMAVLGIITIPVAYLTFRTMFSRSVGFFAAVLLSIGMWHLHYSRIGFMVISWPLMELLTLLFLFLGIQTKRWLFFGLSGLAFGAGVYTYNAYPVFALPMALLFAWLIGRELLAWFTKNRTGRELLVFAGQLILFAVMTGVAALPMILYASDPNEHYLNHHRSVSVLETDEWKADDLSGKVDFTFDRTRHFFYAAFWHGEADGADGAGTSAMVDRVSVALVAIGVLILLARWRRPSSIAVLLAFALLPIASIFTYNALFRRSVGLVPFIAVLAAMPLAFWWDRAKGFGPLWRNASYAGMAAIITFVGYQNFNSYFQKFPDTELAQFTYGVELAAASEYMHDLPGDPFVYLYSGRWGFDYETRRFLAPDVVGQDRSNEFGTFDLTPTQPGPVAYVFLAPYLDQADEVARLYPGGKLTDHVEDGVVYFRGYYLPSTEGIAQPPTNVTPEPPVVSAEGAAERDATREQDFAVIAAALEQYKQAHGAYPDTAGQVQSLCVFLDYDVGCALNEVLDPIPQDPLGDPGANGYWYAATKNEYRVYSKRETDTIPLCPEHPPHLGGFDSIYCVIGP
ncbi:MAG: glycosyltransferase family 39 protein [Dehalococcoidia bacterium]